MLTGCKKPLLIWGTYDLSKPRVRLLIEGLRQHGVEFEEIHDDIWAGVRDKGTLSFREQIGAVWRWVRAIPGLLGRYGHARDHRAVLVPYLGLFDLLVLAPFARWRGVPLVWDLFISPYDTVVNDRRMFSPWHPVPLMLFACEWLASRLASRLFLDTEAHARRFESLMRLPVGRVGAVPLGTNPAQFPPRAGAPTVHTPLRIFFYGQYIPLHGLETVVRAARVLEGEGLAVQWTFAGTGQERDRIAALIKSLGVTSVEQVGWVAPPDLPSRIHAADVGLGIFGTSAKALTVVPNKVYEMAATQTPFITGDTWAMREFAPDHPWVVRSAPGDPAALAECVRRIVERGSWPSAPPLPVVGPREVGAAFLRVTERVV